MSIKSGRLEGGVQVRIFDPDTEVYGEVPEYALAIEYEYDDEDRFRGGVTIGRFVGDKPHGLNWQWNCGEIYHGLLYGMAWAGKYIMDCCWDVYRGQYHIHLSRPGD